MLAVIADDLTGALDTGVHFHQAGLACQVVLPPALPEEFSPAAPAIIVDTETRRAEPAEAAAIVSRWGARLQAAGVTTFYKKIDSTLRGPWASELAALREAIGAARVFVCPAYPALGRVVRGGVVWRVDRSPATRIGDVSEALRGATPLRVEILAPGAEPALDTTFAVLDAETEADLHAWAAWIAGRAPGALLCGSAGLAAASAPGLGGTAQPTPQPECRRVLVVAGSRSPVAREQVRVLARRPGVVRVSLADPPGKTVAEAALLAAPPSAPETRETPIVARTLAQAAAALHAASPFDGLILTGGETALQLLAALEASGVDLLGEALPGMPLCIARGGAAAGASIVTKAGAFGEPDTLARLVRRLQGHPL